MSTPKEIVLTPEQLELNRKRAMRSMGYLETDPDKENPELAASLTKAIEEHNAAIGILPEAKEDKKDEPPTQTEEERAAAEALAKEQADAKAKEEADAKKLEEDAKEKEKPDPEVETEAAKTALTSDIDIEQVAERAAARAVELAQKKEPAPVKSTVEDSLPEDYKEDLEVLRLIESKNPAMAGMSAKALDFWGKEDAYIAAWQAAHPGQDFDDESEDHAAFYAKMPEVPPDLMERTRKELHRNQIKKEVLQEIDKEQAPKRAKEEFERKYSETAPVALSVAGRAVIEMIEKTDPELYKVLLVDGKPVISEATIEALAAADPTAFEVMNENAEKLRIMRAELHKMVNVEGYKPNNATAIPLVSIEGETFFPHAELQRFAGALENEFSKMAPDASSKDGKKFIRQGDLNGRIGKILESDMPTGQKEAALKALEARFWALGEGEISAALVNKFAAQSKTRIEKFKGNSDRGGAKADATAAAKAQKEAEAIKKQKDEAAAKAAAEAAKNAPSRRAPTTTTASDKIDTSGKTTGPTGLTKEQVLKSMWG